MAAEPASTPVVEDRPAPTPAPAPAPVVQAAPAPVVDISDALRSSGLVLIETDRSKAAAPATEVVEPPAPRPRRERRPPPAGLDQPLVQVETDNKP